jgi:hypothetical protein
LASEEGVLKMAAWKSSYPDRSGSQLMKPRGKQGFVMEYFPTAECLTFIDILFDSFSMVIEIKGCTIKQTN